MGSLNREALKDFLSNVIGQVTLDPATHECQINYRIGINLGYKMASPRGGAPIPVLRIMRNFFFFASSMRNFSRFTN